MGLKVTGRWTRKLLCRELDSASAACRITLEHIRAEKTTAQGHCAGTPAIQELFKQLCSCSSNTDQTFPKDILRPKLKRFVQTIPSRATRALGNEAPSSNLLMTECSSPPDPLYMPSLPHKCRAVTKGLLLALTSAPEHRCKLMMTAWKAMLMRWKYSEYDLVVLIP